jgi:hypothetical protein
MAVDRTRATSGMPDVGTDQAEMVAPQSPVNVVDPIGFYGGRPRQPESIAPAAGDMTRKAATGLAFGQLPAQQVAFGQQQAPTMQRGAAQWDQTWDQPGYGPKPFQMPQQGFPQQQRQMYQQQGGWGGQQPQYQPFGGQQNSMSGMSGQAGGQQNANYRIQEQQQYQPQQQYQQPQYQQQRQPAFNRGSYGQPQQPQYQPQQQYQQPQQQQYGGGGGFQQSFGQQQQPQQSRFGGGYTQPQQQYQAPQQQQHQPYGQQPQQQRQPAQMQNSGVSPQPSQGPSLATRHLGTGSQRQNNAF